MTLKAVWRANCRLDYLILPIGHSGWTPFNRGTIALGSWNAAGTNILKLGAEATHQSSGDCGHFCLQTQHVWTLAPGEVSRGWPVHLFTAASRAGRHQWRMSRPTDPGHHCGSLGGMTVCQLKTHPDQICIFLIDQWKTRQGIIGLGCFIGHF